MDFKCGVKAILLILLSTYFITCLNSEHSFVWECANKIKYNFRITFTPNDIIIGCLTQFNGSGIHRKSTRRQCSSAHVPAVLGSVWSCDQVTKNHPWVQIQKEP